MPKRRLKRVLVVLGAPLALAFLAVLLADTGWVKRRLLTFADGKLRSELGLSLSAGGSTIRLNRLAVGLRDVRLVPVTPGTGPLQALTASEVFVDLPWSVLFTGRVRVQDVRIVRPRLEVRIPDGEAGPPVTAEGPSVPSRPAAPVRPFSFEIEKLSILDGAVVVAGTGRSLTLSLDDIGLALRLQDQGPDHRLTLRTGGGRFALDGSPLDIRSLEADIVLDAKRIDVERAVLATPLSRLDVRGRIGDYQSAPSFDLAITAALSLEEAAALVPSLPPARGSIAVEGRLEKSPASGAATVAVRSASLLVEGYPDAALRLSAASDLRVVTLEELVLESAGARLEARGVVRPPGSGGSRLDLSWDGFDLALLSSLMPDRPHLEAVSRGWVTAVWDAYRLDSLRASGQASFRSTPRTATVLPAYAGFLPLSGSIAFTTARDGVDLTRASFEAAGAALSLAGHMGWDGAVRAEFEAGLPDLGAALRAAAALAGPAVDLPAIEGRSRIEGTVRGTVTAPVLRASLAASDLAWNGIDAGSIEASLGLDGPIVEISRFKAELASSVLEGRLALRPSPTGKPGPAGLVIDAEASSPGLDLAFLAPFLPNSPPAGRIAFEAQGSGPIGRPTFEVRLDGRGVGSAGVRVPFLSLTAGSDGSVARARLTAAPAAGIPPPLVVEAELPLASPYPVKASWRAEGLVLDDFIVDRTDTAPAAVRPHVSLNADGSLLVPLEDLSGSDLALSFKGLDLASLAALAGAAVPPGIGGEADLRLRAKGDPTRPGALTVEGELARLVFSGNLPAFETRGPVRFALRDGVFSLERFALSLGDSSLAVSGSVRGLDAEPAIEVRASIDADATLIPPGFLAASVGGRLTLDLVAEGPAVRPVVGGRGRLASGFLRPRDLPLTLSDLSLGLEVRDRAVLVTDGRALANGGLLSFSGRVGLDDGFGVERAEIDAVLEGLRLDYPPGLVTVSDGRMRIEGDGKAWLVSGRLRVLQGSFRQDIFPGAELLGFSNLPLLPESDTTAAAEAVRLDIAVATVEPIVVRNNMADLGLRADLRVTGTLAAPRIAGRVESEPVGQIVFGERRYTLDTLRLEFLGRPVPDPEVAVEAHTRLVHRMEDLEVRLRLSGPASDLKFDLTSTPPRSSRDLSLLLLTGRSLDEVRGETLDTLKGQMILHFTSPLLSPVTRSLERFLGVDDVSFTPMSIASEEDPGARLTFVKNLSNQLTLTYSLDVTQTERQSWLLDYGLSRKFLLQAYRKDDGSYGGSFRHSVPFGGERADRPAETEILAGVRIEAGDGGASGTGLERRRLEKAIKPLRVGRPFRVSDLGRAAAGLNRLYRKNAFLDATVVPVVERRSDEDGGEDGPARVTVAFRVEPGAPAVLAFRGDRIPGKLRTRVLDAWTGKLPESANLETGREIIRAELRRSRYYRAEVEAEALPAEAGRPKTYAFTVSKNGRYRVRSFAVEDGGAVGDPVVRRAASAFPLAESRGLWNVVHSPRLALRSVKRAYEERGYAQAAVEIARLEEDREARAVDITIGVTPGPRHVVRSVAFEGRAVLEERDLRAVVGFAAGSTYDPARAAAGRTALLNLYRGRGYQSAEVRTALSAAGGDGDGTGDAGIDITYEIAEGPRHTVASVEVGGGERTGEGFVRGASGLKADRALTSEDLGRGQKRIYDTRLFRSVDIASEPVGGDGGAAAGAGEVRETVRIGVREMPPVTLSYGLRYNSEVKLEGVGEIDLRSPFGEGLSGLLSGRHNRNESDLRFSVESSYLLGLRFNLLSTVYTRREVRELFTSDDTGLTLQSRFRLPSRFDLSALYRMNRIHTYDPAAPGVSPLEEKVFVSEIGALLLRDTRDDLLDPKRGSLLSLSLAWSPSFLPTEMPYVSVFGQAQVYRRFGPGLVWAAAGRLGVADAFEGELVAAKRFFAGGGHSVRGFVKDGVGPVDPLLGLPAGGQVVAVMNQELRFPLFGPASGVVFYDAGAVFPTMRDVRLEDIRHGLGLGLRVRSPVGLVRLDYGLNLGPRAGERRAVFYLSIGQAF